MAVDFIDLNGAVRKSGLAGTDDGWVLGIGEQTGDDAELLTSIRRAEATPGRHENGEPASALKRSPGTHEVRAGTPILAILSDRVRIGARQQERTSLQATLGFTVIACPLEDARRELLRTCRERFLADPSARQRVALGAHRVDDGRPIDIDEVSPDDPIPKRILASRPQVVEAGDVEHHDLYEVIICIAARKCTERFLVVELEDVRGSFPRAIARGERDLGASGAVWIPRDVRTSGLVQSGHTLEGIGRASRSGYAEAAPTRRRLDMTISDALRATLRQRIVDALLPGVIALRSRGMGAGLCAFDESDLRLLELDEARLGFGAFRIGLGCPTSSTDLATLASTAATSRASACFAAWASRCSVALRLLLREPFVGCPRLGLEIAASRPRPVQ